MDFTDEEKSKKMSKLNQVKIPVDIQFNNWKLVRERDGLTKQSAEVMWVEWNEEGKFKSKHDEPAVDRSLIMSPFTMSFTWQTTPITEVLEKQENFLKFKTKNSVYELWKLS